MDSKKVGIARLRVAGAVSFATDAAEVRVGLRTWIVELDAVGNRKYPDRTQPASK